ncbi:hypothetical protein [uncultured Amnibacterium sp.]|uniref:hypothetical protein n=1 Tax=uncultured Amnibacterium sp. TaxID=1631851 RepID=UPI0035CC59AD
MRVSLRTALIVLAMSCAGLLLSGCSSAPSVTGVWSASDGSADKVIGDDGQCSGMYYANGSVLDIGGGETCTLGSKESDGTYPLVVRQPPNQETLEVTFDGDTMKFNSGGKQIVLTKR